MRENDDDSPDQGDGGSLADGIGETAGPDDQSSSTEPYGDSDFDDSYADDDYSEDDYSDDDSGTTADDDVVILDEPDTGSDSGNGGYGEGEGDGGVVIYDEDGSAGDADDGDGSVPDGPDSSFDDSDLLAQDASPLEGIGYLLDEVRDALFGEDDEASSSAFESDPAELESDTDLDLTGDGVVDTADLHEAGHVLDFDVE